MKTTKISHSDNDQPAISPVGKVVEIVRENWLPFVCALTIAILTIIIVPIIYKIRKPSNLGNVTDLHWNNSGTTLFSNVNQPLGNLSSIKFDSAGNLFYLDRSEHQLWKFDLTTKGFSRIFGNENGSAGSDLTSLNAPNDFLLDSSNRIYIVDTMNHRILFISDQTSRQAALVCNNLPSTFPPLKSPMSVTLAQNSTLYIADYGNDRICKCDIGSNTLEMFGGNSSNADRSAYVQTPISIRYDSKQNSLLIAQQLGYNVVRWKLTSSTWTLVAGSVSSNLRGTTRTLFDAICAIEINDLGNVFVVDCLNQRIQFYKSDGVKGNTTAGVIQAAGNTSSVFNQPSSIAFDPQKNLYVADSNNFRIQRFALL